MLRRGFFGSLLASLGLVSSDPVGNGPAMPRFVKLNLWSNNFNCPPPSGLAPFEAYLKADCILAVVPDVLFPGEGPHKTREFGRLVSEAGTYAIKTADALALINHLENCDHASGPSRDSI